MDARLLTVIAYDHLVAKLSPTELPVHHELMPLLLLLLSFGIIFHWPFGIPAAQFGCVITHMLQEYGNF